MPLSAVSIVLSVILIVLYRIFASPLAKIPAVHPLARLTSLYMLWIRYGEQENEVMRLAHEKLGPVVRLEPCELSINCVDDGIRTVYQKPTFEKTAFYTFFRYFGRDNMFSCLEAEHHGRKKRRISNIYAKSYLQSSSDMKVITRTILLHRMMPRLFDHVDHARPLDVMPLFRAAAMDVASSYIFGLQNSTDFLQNYEALSQWLEIYHLSHPKKAMFFLQELPNLTRWLSILGFDLVPEARLGYLDQLNAWCLKMCDQAEASSLNDPRPGDVPTVYSQLKKVVNKEDYSDLKTIQLSCFDAGSQALNMRSPQQLEIASEILDQLIAAHDTSSITMTYICWELSRHATIQTRLQEELRGLGASLDMSHCHADDSLPSPKMIDELPLLHAIIMETLRLHPAVAGAQPRFTPAQGTVKLGAFDGVPAGVRVQAYASSLHQNADAFPDPMGWQPERWLAGKEGERWQGSEKKERWLWAFGSGGRMCIGSNFAIQVIKFILAAIYANLESRIVDDQGIEQRDGYVAGPTGDRLIVSFHELKW